MWWLALCSHGRSNWDEVVVIALYAVLPGVDEAEAVDGRQFELMNITEAVGARAATRAYQFLIGSLAHVLGLRIDCGLRIDSN